MPDPIDIVDEHVRVRAELREQAERDLHYDIPWMEVDIPPVELLALLNTADERDKMKVAIARVWALIPTANPELIEAGYGVPADELIDILAPVTAASPAVTASTGYLEKGGAAPSALDTDELTGMAPPVLLPELDAPPHPRQGVHTAMPDNSSTTQPQPTAIQAAANKEKTDDE